MIRVEHMTKLYRSGKGVENLNFLVSEGETFGFLGPNGAGKTTTMRVLMGYLKMSSGSVEIMGKSCWEDASFIQKNVGYIPGEINFPSKLTGLELLELLSKMQKKDNSKRRNSLMNRFELNADMSIRKMSKGMKQKLAIVAACQHDPSVLLFDEPSAGLDPLMREIFIQFALEEKKLGKTLLISSHDFNEINRVSDRAGIIKEGQLVDIQTMEALKASRRKRFLVTLDSMESIDVLRREGLNLQIEHDNMISVDITGDVNRLIYILSKVKVDDIEGRSLALEDVFMAYYGKEEKL